MSVHGKNARVYVDQYDLSSTLKKADPSATVDKHDTTCFGANSKTFDPGLKDGTLALSGLFTGTAGETDQVLQNALGSSTGNVVSQFPNTDAIGYPARLLKARETSFKCNQAVADLVMVDGEIQADGGIQFGVSLHAKGTETGAGSSASVDNSASSATGWTAHLHVFAFSGTNITVKVRDSADDITYADLCTFTAATGVTAERKQGATSTAAVARYVKETRSGTFSSCSYAVAFARQGP